MGKPTSKPDWNPSLSKVVTPSDTKQSSGWDPEEKPPAQFFNWFWNLISQWIGFLSGNAKYNVIISSDSQEADYTSLEAYLADSPVAGDRVLIKNNQTTTASLVLPSDVSFHLEYDLKVTIGGAYTPAISLNGDNVLTGEFIIVSANTSTITDLIEVNGANNYIENFRIRNTSTGTITNLINLVSGTEQNHINGAQQNVSTGSITNTVTDNSDNETNVYIIKTDELVRSNFSGGNSNGFKNFIVDGGMEEDLHYIEDTAVFIASFPYRYILPSWVYQYNGSFVPVYLSVPVDRPTAGDPPRQLKEPSYIPTRDAIQSQTSTPAALVADSYSIVGTFIKGYDARKLAGKKAILSFWVNNSVPGTYSVCFEATSDAPTHERYYVAEYTVDVAGQWEKKSIPIDFADILSLDHSEWDEEAVVKIWWCLAAGTDYQTSVLGQWQTSASAPLYGSTSQVNSHSVSSSVFDGFFLTEAQLELGQEVTVFEPLPSSYIQSYNDSLLQSSRDATSKRITVSMHTSVDIPDGGFITSIRLGSSLGNTPTVILYYNNSGFLFNKTTAAEFAVSSAASRSVIEIFNNSGATIAANSEIIGYFAAYARIIGAIS